MPSAGLIPFRTTAGGLEILIAHPGGPFWAHRQVGAWSIIKGEVPPGEEPLATALREFHEETGWRLDVDHVIGLGDVTQKAGKTITAWAVEADFAASEIAGDTVTITYRGRVLTFPEIDEVRWCGKAECERLLNPAQVAYYERLNTALNTR
ncbi:MAG TPA: NUDIX domain-containing protein [Acidimicrobiia bacterium]|nr:NUDIX domain-containing protein [Acidimicrobiia bacterium]